MDADRFRELLSHWAATVGVAAVRDEDRVYGTTITSFTPVNADPPVVLVSLGPNAQVLPFLETGSRFTVNLLEESQGRWAEVFADPYPVGPSPFADSGDPILDGALVSLVCRVQAVVDAGGGARVVLAAVVDGEARDGRRPLLWHRRGPTHLPPDR
jgi:flavin reductase (DIM6/NTAB) family NADH-FMN oxidoreductase RutF